MEVNGGGSFEWSIDRFLENKGELKQSSPFEIWEDICCLEVPRRDGKLSLYYPFYLTDISTCSEDTAFELCLIDKYGKEFFVTKRTVYNIFSEQLLLITMQDEELRGNAYNLLPNGVLTVRLSWYEEKNEAVNQPETLGLISNKGTMLMLETLSKDFSHFYESKENTDFVLRAGDVQFPVHRVVLSARSKVFAAVFRHDTSETRSGIVEIPDVEAECRGNLLHYVYSGKVHGLTTHNAGTLYIMADKYALIELKDFCRDFLMHTLTTENVCDAAVLADTQGEAELEEKVLQFIEDRIEEVQDSTEWKRLSVDKPSLVIKLLSLIVMACKDKIREMPSN